MQHGTREEAAELFRAVRVGSKDINQDRVYIVMPYRHRIIDHRSRNVLLGMVKEMHGLQ